MMFWTLIQKEILEQISSIRFSVSIILALLFLVPSTYMLATDYGWLHEERGPQKGFSTSGGSWYDVGRDIPTLRILATGLDENLSLHASNKSFTIPQFAYIPFVHNPLRYLVSQLDFVFFINIIGSLMAFAFTYDAISGERQRGTLRLIMAQPIPRPLFILSKFLGNYFSFVITLLPALMVISLVLFTHPDVNIRPLDFRAMCFIFLMATISLSAFFMLGLFVSCVTKEPKTTLTALMALWVLLVLVIPSFSPLLAVKLRPVRSLYQVVSQIATLKEDVFFQTKKKLSDITQGRNWDAMGQLEREIVGQIWDEYFRQQMNLTAKEIAEIRLAFLNEVEAQAKFGMFHFSQKITLHFLDFFFFLTQGRRRPVDPAGKVAKTQRKILSDFASLR